MAANEFEKTSFVWQIQQWQQQLSEWIELKLSQNSPNLSNLSIPSWLEQLLKVLWPLLKVVSWLILALALIWLSWQLWLILRPYIYSLSFEMGNSTSKSMAVKEVMIADWWQRSQQFYRQGNYAEAARCLYMAMLQKLHDTHLIPHQPSRTDGEYRQLIQSLPKHSAYQVLLNTHEQLCFGNADISSTEFEQCQQAYRQIEENK